MSAAGKERALTRTRARLGAVQALYQMELAETDLSDILAQYGSGAIVQGLDEDEKRTDDFEFFKDLVTGVVRKQRDIDPKIDECLAGNWKLSRLDSILRAILRAGTYELSVRTDVPAPVVINEYLDVAHAFFSEDEPKFVNGVLDRLARELRNTEAVQ